MLFQEGDGFHKSDPDDRVLFTNGRAEKSLESGVLTVKGRKRIITLSEQYLNDRMGEGFAFENMKKLNL